MGGAVHPYPAPGSHTGPPCTKREAYYNITLQETKQREDMLRYHFVVCIEPVTSYVATCDATALVATGGACATIPRETSYTSICAWHRVRAYDVCERESDRKSDKCSCLADSQEGVVSRNFPRPIHANGSRNNFSHANGNRNNVSHANGSRNNFSHANGSRNNVSHANGSRNNFSHANGSRNNVSHANGSRNNFRHANGSRNNVSHSNGSRNNFRHANGSRNNVSHSNGSRNNFRHANGSRNNVSHTNGSRNNFSRRQTRQMLRNCEYYIS
ncbi:hypothetical protein B566_EDAN006621 [Ephemera danica]|nr:hypothetical protein B566_EDAN006621 [Ephemera danica]